MPEEQKETGIFSRYNLLSLYLPAVILALGTGIASPALPVFTKSFEISFGVASLVIIVHMVGGALASVPTGYMIDRIGRRKIVLTGPILTALSSFLIVTAHSFPELLVYRFLGGWASQMWSLARLAIIADTGKSTQRGRQITGMMSMEGVGRLLGPAVGGFVAHWDIRIPFILHGLFCLIAVIPSFKMIEETAPSRLASQGGSRDQGTISFRASLASLFIFPVMMLFFVQFLVALTRGLVWGGTLNLYAVYAYDVGAAMLGILATVSSVVGIPITFAAGHLMDRFGRKTTVVPGFSLLSASLFFMAATAYAHLSFTAFVVAFLAVHWAQSLTGGSMQTMGSDLAPPNARGQFFGVWRFMQDIGTVLSPTLFTLIAEYYGFTAAFLFLSVTALSVAALVGTQVSETLKK